MGDTGDSCADHGYEGVKTESECKTALDFLGDDQAVYVGAGKTYSRDIMPHCFIWWPPGTKYYNSASVADDVKYVDWDAASWGGASGGEGARPVCSKPPPPATAPSPSEDAASCTDTPGWQNGYNYGCVGPNSYTFHG